MIFEGLVAAACIYGNNDACISSLTGYAKHYKLDEQAQAIEKNVKKKYPIVHMTGVAAGVVIQKKYNVLIYRNLWLELDVSDFNNKRSMVVYKYSF